MKKTLSILLVTVATLTMAACGNTTTEKVTTQSSAETSQKANAETTYPLTVKTYDAKGNEVEQVFDKAPEKVITNNLSTTEILLELGLKDKIVGMMGRNMMFSEKSLGAVSTWNENKIPVYTQKASLSTIQQDLGNIVEDVKNLGMIFNVQDKANEYAAQLQTKIDAVKKANPASQGEKKKALIMVAYNDETFGAYKSALQESLLNQLGYTNVATGTSGLTLENLVSMDPELIIYVTSDRNKKLDEKAVELMKANAVLESVPAIKNQKIMTISYDELMDYGPAVIDSLEKINDFINK